ncbi:MAG: hypothetical protein C4523_20555 [Myxococcales bacterium]|nr:MAG: hypothetical protein C4523_20555 [Myxococcales bacterium]
MGKRTICAVVLALLLAPSVQAAEGIVVWRMEAKTGVSDKDIDSISGFVTAEVEKNSGRSAVSDADINTILAGEEKKQRCGVDGASCIAEIGSALGVPEVVSGDLGRLGDYWILNLRRINVRTAQAEARVSRQIRGDMNALIEAIPSAVAELFGKIAAEPPPPAPPAPQPMPEPAPEPPEAKPAMSTLGKAAFGTFFPGLALVAFGGIAQWQMNEALSDYEGGDKDAKDRHAAWKGVSAASYAIGGAAMATGIVLWIVDAMHDNDDAQADTPKAAGGLSPAPGGAAVQIMVTW